MKIGELAKATQTPVETIRFYEREGLLAAAPRSQANYRVYGAEQAQRLSFIRHCRSLDMALDEIRQLLRFKDTPQQDCAAVNALLDEHIEHVAQRLRELRLLQRQLLALREQCAQVDAAAQCGILNGLERSALAPAAATTGHTRHISGTHGAPAATRAKR